MPKTIFIPKDASRAGIVVTWVKSTQKIDIGGWFDSFVGIPGESMSLRNFFDALGITEKDCQKAFRKVLP